MVRWVRGVRCPLHGAPCPPRHLLSVLLPVLMLSLVPLAPPTAADPAPGQGSGQYREFCSSAVLLLFYCCSLVFQNSATVVFFRIVLLLFRYCSKGSVLFHACFRGVFLVMSHRVHPRSSVVQNCPQSAARFHPFLLQDSRLVPPSCSALFQYCSNIVFSQRSVSSSPLERYH